MKVSMCKTMRTYEWKNLSKDLLAGLVIMAVSIPISMGYAQIAGLPAVYGLYGSVFPIVLFAKGAIQAAKFLKGKEPGWYQMSDVIG